MEPEHDAAPVRPLEADPQHVHGRVKRTHRKPERAERQRGLPHPVARAGPEQRQEHGGLGEPQHHARPDPLDQLLGADTADPREDRHGREEDGQEPVRYPVPVLDRGYAGHQEGKGHALREETHRQGRPAVPQACVCHGGTA